MMANFESTAASQLAEAVAARYGRLPEVLAVAWGGSWGAGMAEPGSDIDLYVYTRAEIPPEIRATVALARTTVAEIDNRFWEPGDEWIEGDPPIGVDVMFRSPAWIEAQIGRVLSQHEASVGYTTCFWYNVLNSRGLYDPHGWFGALQRSVQVPYPEPLRLAIVDKNYPILRETFSSYRHQIERAVGRGDLVSINHRVAAFLASYFDILFAVNRQPHPGEKRLVAIAQSCCSHLPEDFEASIAALLRAAGTGGSGVVDACDDLVSGLDEILINEDLLLGRMVWSPDELDSEEDEAAA